MKIGDEVMVHGYVDEIRTGIVIIKNDGGWFGTVPDEVKDYYGRYEVGDRCEVYADTGEFIKTGTIVRKMFIPKGAKYKVKSDDEQYSWVMEEHIKKIESVMSEEEKKEAHQKAIMDAIKLLDIDGWFAKYDAKIESEAYDMGFYKGKEEGYKEGKEEILQDIENSLVEKLNNILKREYDRGYRDGNKCMTWNGKEWVEDHLEKITKPIEE